jgi:hypothetical protein
MLLVLFGCVSAPSPVSSEESTDDKDKPPSWVAKRPEDDSTYKYFVGSGTSNTGDQAEAKSIAGGEIYSAIQRFMGVDVKSISIAENRASLDEFKTSITQIVTQEGSARVAGFEIVESWADAKRKPAVTIHLLARYNKQELAKEKKRQEELLREELESIAGPEREGRESVAAGRYYDGAKEFLIAASNALNSKLENTDIRFKRNLDQAVAAIDQINLIKLNDNIEGMVGQKLPEPLKIKVSSGPSESDSGIPNVNLRVIYRELHRSSGKLRPRETEITTDQEGFASFQHPIPSFVGRSEVTLALILDLTLEGLDKATTGQQELVENLAEVVARKKVQYRLDFSSGAKEIKTGILLLEYDSEENLTGFTEGTSALKSALYDFDLAGLTVSPRDVDGKSDLELGAFLSEKFGNQVERIIFGTVRIVSFRKSGNKTVAKAAGTVQVIEAATGSILYSSQREKSGLGDDERSASLNAYKSIGSQLGKEIRNNLK